MTFINEHLDHTEGGMRPLSPGLQAEIARDEHDVEFYGGDGVQEPEDLKKAVPTGKQAEEEQDPNLVTWDGPNDQSNPQNWSTKYKWFVTIVCCVMTVNV